MICYIYHTWPQWGIVISNAFINRQFVVSKLLTFPFFSQKPLDQMEPNFALVSTWFVLKHFVWFFFLFWNPTWQLASWVAYFFWLAKISNLIFSELQYNIEWLQCMNGAQMTLYKVCVLLVKWKSNMAAWVILKKNRFLKLTS